MPSMATTGMLPEKRQTFNRAWFPVQGARNRNREGERESQEDGVGPFSCANCKPNPVWFCSLSASTDGCFGGGTASLV